MREMISVDDYKLCYDIHDIARKAGFRVDVTVCYSDYQPVFALRPTHEEYTEDSVLQTFYDLKECERFLRTWAMSRMYKEIEDALTKRKQEETK
jgi:hypothetical protein